MQFIRIVAGEGLEVWVDGKLHHTLVVPDYNPQMNLLNDIAAGGPVRFNYEDGPFTIWQGEYAVLDTLGLSSKIHNVRYDNLWVRFFLWVKNCLPALPIPYLEKLMDFMALLSESDAQAFFKEVVAITPDGTPIVKVVEGVVAYWKTAHINTQGQVILTHWGIDKVETAVLESPLKMVDTYRKINEDLKRPSHKTKNLHVEDFSALSHHYWGLEPQGEIVCPTSSAFSVLLPKMPNQNSAVQEVAQS
jgi:hypothetical protein